MYVDLPYLGHTQALLLQCPLCSLLEFLKGTEVKYFVQILRNQLWLKYFLPFSFYRIMDSCSYGNCILATNDLDELLCWHLNSTNRMLKHSLKKAECPCVLDQKYEKTKLLLSNLCKSLIVADCNTITFYDVCSEI